MERGVRAVIRVVAPAFPPVLYCPAAASHCALGSLSLRRRGKGGGRRLVLPVGMLTLRLEKVWTDHGRGPVGLALCRRADARSRLFS